MAIALFPLLDGGTISANIALYGEYIGAQTTLAMRRRLFGYPCKPDTRLPSGLNHLAEQARDYWKLEPAEIILHNTEFYYATATVPAKQRESMFSDMLKQPGSRCSRRSASGWTGERVSKFRYCEDCLSDWRAARIPAHWMVDHQLPGVYVCPVHSSVMKVAKQGLPQILTDVTVTALTSSDDETLLARASSSELRAIAAVAILSADYRKGRRSLSSVATYRELLRFAGFLWPTGGVDIRAFTAAMIEHLGLEYCQLAGLSSQRLTTWLRNLGDQRRVGEFAHPFISIAAESLLTGRCAMPGSFVPQNRKENAGVGLTIEDNNIDKIYQKENVQLCSGILHRNGDKWQDCFSDEAGWTLVCSCGVSYKISKISDLVGKVASVNSYGERYRRLISMGVADNFILKCESGEFYSINPRLLRWARFSGFSRRKHLSAEMLRELRERWCSVVAMARPDKRITSSYQIDSRLYRKLYECDRDWIVKFNQKRRTRRFGAQLILKDDEGAAEFG